MSIYRGHELIKHQKGWWVWLKDTRVNDWPISSEEQAKVLVEVRKTGTAAGRQKGRARRVTPPPAAFRSAR